MLRLVMRRALLISTLLLAASCGRAPAPERLYVTLGADALPAAQALTGAHVALDGTDHDVALIEIDAAQIDALADVMHAQFARCGGFFVHDSLADAEAALHAVPQPHRAADYTLDRAELVTRLLPQLDPARIRNTIAELSAMKNRYYQSQSGAAASTWLAERWRGLSTRSDVTVEQVEQGWAQRSVIMTIPGTTHPDEIVVIGGHLDSIALGGATSTAPGADDDASGIATVTEIARVFLASDVRPARTVQFMGYAAEEVGLRGSQAIAKDYGKRGLDVVGALQLDMTNYRGSEKDIWLMKDFTSAAQNAFLIQLIDTYVGATWGLDACGYGCSDHASWYRAGVPASMPFEARFRDHNKKIHSRNDTLEASDANAAHALKFARLGLAYALELAKP